jgi:hypothetical protein
MAVFPMPRGVFHAGQVHYGRKTQKSKCGIQSSLATTSCNQGSSRKPWPRADLLSLTTSTLVEATSAARHFCSSLDDATAPIRDVTPHLFGAKVFRHSAKSDHS